MLSRLLLCLLFCSSACLADVYKCRTADGRIEFSNAPCAPGASLLKSRPDEPVSEASRRQAERDVDRMRDYLDKRETSQQNERAAEQEAQRQAAERAAARPPAKSYGNSQDCLRDAERSLSDADCRRFDPPATVYVPVPVGVPGRLPHRPEKPERPARAAPEPAPTLATPTPPGQGKAAKP